MPQKLLQLSLSVIAGCLALFIVGFAGSTLSAAPAKLYPPDLNPYTKLISHSHTTQVSSSTESHNHHSLKQTMVATFPYTNFVYMPLFMKQFKPIYHINLSVSDLSFGYQAISTTQIQAIYITNNGNKPLTIDEIAFTNSLTTPEIMAINKVMTLTNSFTETNTCSGLLYPLTTCVISITFSPYLIADFNSTLFITVNESSETYQVELSGQGSQVVHFEEDKIILGSITATLPISFTFMTLGNNEVTLTQNDQIIFNTPALSYSVGLYTISIQSNEDLIQDIVTTINSSSPIYSAMPNVYIRGNPNIIIEGSPGSKLCKFSTSSGTLSDSQRNLQSIRVVDDNGSRLMTQTGDDITIAIFDTLPYPLSAGQRKKQSIKNYFIEISYPALIQDHLPHLPGSIKLPFITKPGQHASHDCAPDIANHGEIVADLIHTVAPNSDLHLIKVLDDNGIGTVYTLTQALHSFSSTLATYNIPFSKTIINLSLGVPPNSAWDYDNLIPFKEVLQYVFYDQGTMIVAAAGNGSTPNNVLTSEIPASYPFVLSVSSVDITGNLANYSNQGDVAAPGGIPCELHKLDDCLAVWSQFSAVAVTNGTSFAAPMVTGVVALALEKWGNSLTNNQIMQLIKASANPPNRAKIDPKLGTSLIDTCYVIEGASCYLWRTAIILQNPSLTNLATFGIIAHAIGSTDNYTAINCSVSPGKFIIYNPFTPADIGFSGNSCNQPDKLGENSNQTFRGSAIISSTSTLVSIVNIGNQPTGKASAAHQGINGNATANTLFFPVAKNNYFGQTSIFYIQAMENATVTVTYGSGQIDGPHYIEAGRSRIFLPDDAKVPDYNGGTLTNISFASSSGKIAGVVIEQPDLSSTANFILSARLFAQSEADTTLYAPILKNDFSNGVTGLVVQAIGGDVTIEVDFSIIKAETGASCLNSKSNPITIPNGETQLIGGGGDFNLPSDFGNGCFGSAKITVVGGTGKIVAAVNETSSQGKAVYAAIPASAVSKRVAVPVVKEAFWNSRTSVVVQAIGLPTETTVITATYFTKSGSCTNGCTIALKGTVSTSKANTPGGGIVNFRQLNKYPSEYTVISGVLPPLNSINSVIIESDNLPVVVIAQETGPLDLKNYEGFPQ